MPPVIYFQFLAWSNKNKFYHLPGNGIFGCAWKLFEKTLISPWVANGSSCTITIFIRPLCLLGVVHKLCHAILDIFWPHLPAIVQFFITEALLLSQNPWPLPLGRDVIYGRLLNIDLILTFRPRNLHFRTVFLPCWAVCLWIPITGILNLNPKRILRFLPEAEEARLV